MPASSKPKLFQSASLGVTAISTAVKNDGHPKFRQDLLERIKKCFDRANHAAANPSEAEAATRMAFKIMQTHNIHQSDLMQHEDAQTKAKRAGASEVDIIKLEHHKMVKSETWVSYLASAICVFFDVKAYNTDWSWKIVWTFYGVSESTATAAFIFVRMYELTVHEASKRSGRSTRNSYCLGVSEGLTCIAEDEHKVAKGQAMRNERNAIVAARKEERAGRNAELTGQKFVWKPEIVSKDADEASNPDEIMHDVGQNTGKDSDVNNYTDEWHGFSDNEADDAEANDDTVRPDYRQTDAPDIDPSEGNFEENLRRFIKPEGDDLSAEKSLADLPVASTERDFSNGTTVKREQDLVQAQWQSPQQLTLWREDSAQIADNYLEERKIKLRKARKYIPDVKDLDAYAKGKKDSKEINEKARRERIEN